MKKDEILDNKLEIQEQIKARHSFWNWITIIILWFGIGLCLYDGMITNTQVIIGIVLLLLSSIFTFLNPAKGVIFTLGIIILGTFHLGRYFPMSTSISFGIGNIGLGIEVTMLLMGLIHIITNKKIVQPTLGGLFNKKITEEESQAIERSQVNKFKNRFTEKSTDELNEIANNENLLPEAIMAAKELLKNRGTE